MPGQDFHNCDEILQSTCSELTSEYARRMCGAKKKMCRLKRKADKLLCASIDVQKTQKFIEEKIKYAFLRKDLNDEESPDIKKIKYVLVKYLKGVVSTECRSVVESGRTDNDEELKTCLANIETYLDGTIQMFKDESDFKVGEKISAFVDGFPHDSIITHVDEGVGREADGKHNIKYTVQFTNNGRVVNGMDANVLFRTPPVFNVTWQHARAVVPGCPSRFMADFYARQNSNGYNHFWQLFRETYGDFDKTEIMIQWLDLFL